MEASLLGSGVLELFATGFWSFRTDEQYAASVGYSDRVSVSRVVIRTQLTQRLGAEVVRYELHIEVPGEFIQISLDERWFRSTVSIRAVLAKLSTVLDKLRSALSLEEEFGVDPGVVTTKPEYTEDFNGGGSEG